jgi:hypothetical protein
MFNTLRNSFSRKNNTNMYSYLPDQIQDEIRSAMEATSIYDIR